GRASPRGRGGDGPGADRACAAGRRRADSWKAHRRHRAEPGPHEHRAAGRPAAPNGERTPMKTVTYFFLVAALAAATLLAQEPPPKPSPKPAAGKAEPAPEPKPEKGRGTPLVNVRVDVKIIDERAGQPATTKVVSMTVADRQNGWFRS